MKVLEQRLQLCGSRRTRRCGRSPVAWLLQSGHRSGLGATACCWGRAEGLDDPGSESACDRLKVHPQSEQHPVCWARPLASSNMVPPSSGPMKRLSPCCSSGNNKPRLSLHAHQIELTWKMRWNLYSCTRLINKSLLASYYGRIDVRYAQAASARSASGAVLFRVDPRTSARPLG